MALQSQTHANSGNAYYITNYAPSFNPSTMVSLRSPVEIIFTSSIQTDFYGYLDQTPSSFTLSENNSNLSTVNSLVFDPVVPKTTMNVYNVNNANAESVIQQWSLTSSIVNGVFKVGNKALNNEPDALIMTNSGNVTNLRQGNELNMIIDGPNQRTRFTGVTDPLTYVDIGSGYGSVPKGNVRCANDSAGNAIQISPTVVSFNGGAGAITPYGRTGVGNIAPNTYFMTARTGIDFVVDDIVEVITPLSLNQNGTATMISTLNVPNLRQNDVLITIDGAGQKTSFTSPLVVDVDVEIGQGTGSLPSGSMRCAHAALQYNNVMNYNTNTYNAAGDQRAQIGVSLSEPRQLFIDSRVQTEFHVDSSSANISSLVLKQDGTVNMISTLNVPTLKQGNVIQTIDGANTRTRFANVTDSATAYVEINEIPTAPSLIVLNSLAQVKITPSTIAISNFSASPSQVAKIGTMPAFPNTFMIESYRDTQIRTNINSYSTATFKEDGTTELLSTLVVPTIVMKENNIQYGSIDIASYGAKPLVISARDEIVFQVDSAGANFVYPLQLKQNGTASFTSTMIAPYIECYDIYLQQIIAFNENTAVPVKASLKIEEQPYGAVPAGSNYLQSPRILLKDTFISPKVFYPAGNSASQIIQNTLQGTYGAPANAANSMEFVNNSQNTSGGFQYYHAQDGNTGTPEWLGGFTYSPKQFILASTLTASLPFIANCQSASINALTNVSTASILQLTNVSSATISTAIINIAQISTASINVVTNINTASIQSLINVSSLNTLPISLYIQPTGSIIAYAGAFPNVPKLGTLWVLCDGALYDGTNALYFPLWDIIGGYYGGTGQASFAVPDLRTRTIFGSVTNDFSGASNFSFTMSGSSFSSLPAGSVAPTGKANRQCIAVFNIEAGQELSVGMRVRTANPLLDPVEYQIDYILSYIGGSGTYTQPNYPIIVLNSAMAVDLNNTACIITANSNGLNLSASSTTNKQSQDAYAVGPHTHSGQNNSSAVSGAANQRSEPTAGDTGYNVQNLYYTIGNTNIIINPVFFRVPAVMDMKPSNIAMNYLIHL